MRGRTRLRTEGVAALLWSVRITVAATLSYVVALLLFSGAEPLLAPLTAMLVVQVTPVSLLASGLDRVVAVVAGVAVAVVFADVFSLEWWSLGLLIFVSMTLGALLRLRANRIEVAISGMLVLGVGSFSAGTAAWQRIAETLVGAAVGVAGNLLFPPKVASADAGNAIDGLADSLSQLLSRAADQLVELAKEDDRDVAAAAHEWLDEARTITHDIPNVGAALLRAEESRRLNVRAVGTPNVGPGLRQGLEALEHSAVAIRGMLRALLDATQDGSWPGEETEFGLLGLAETFRAMAAGLDAFGQLVRDDAGPNRTTSGADVDVLRDALEGLHDARARLEEELTSGTASHVELHASVLATVKRLLRELDLDERIRRQLRLPRPTRPRLPRLGVHPTDDGPVGEPTSEAETQVLRRLPPDERHGHRS